MNKLIINTENKGMSQYFEGMILLSRDRVIREKLRKIMYSSGGQRSGCKRTNSYDDADVPEAYVLNIS